MSSSQTPPSNETETPDEAGAKPATQVAGAAPFRRGQIVWGRPPQAVFRAGPLPRDEGLARLLAMPPHPEPPKPLVRGSTAVGAGNGLIGGSNIPLGRPKATSAAAPAAAKPTANSGGGLMTGSLVPGAGMPRLQAKAAEAVPVGPVVPEPVENAPVNAAASSKTMIADRTAQEGRIDSVLEPVVASSSRRARPVAVAEEAALPSSSLQASRKGPSRLMMAATAALVIAAGGAAVWWSQKGHPDNPPLASETTESVNGASLPEVQTGTVSSVEPPVTQAQQAPVPPQTAPAASSTVAAPANTAAQRTDRASSPTPAVNPATARPQPMPVPVPEATAPALEPSPVVIVTPPAETVQGPPPTAAAPQQNNPDAPVVTRPQKLD